MKEIIASLPDQILEGSRITPSGRKSRKQFDSVLVCGMGGSGISGEILKVLYPKIRMITNHDYSIPTSVNRHTLAILVSYSGNTEETLANYRMAQKRGATLALISSNGELFRKQAACKVKIPGGYPPRGALGYLFSPLPGLLHRFGIIRQSPLPEMRKLALFLKKEQPLIRKHAQQLAQKIYNKFPILYVDSAQFWPAAYRWQCQLNENAKMLAHVNIVPEMNHNEIVGLGEPVSIRRHSVLLFLHDPQAHPRNRVRMQIMKQIIRPLYGPVREVQPRGRTQLKRLFWTMLLGDFVSYYCALRRGVDPMPVARIDLLKKRLARSRYK